MKKIDITSRLGQFAWRQITPSTIPLPVIFRHDNREEYLCAQMINIHYLSKFSSESLSYYMKQFPLQYFSITESEAKLFQMINRFHSNGYLAKSNQLDYSKGHSAYITPFLSFVQFYQFITSNLQLIENNNLYFASKYQETMKKQSSSREMISSSPPNECKSKNSYCRTVIFQGKEIVSFITTSATDSNQMILCLSINDIVSTYFPSRTSEEFIQLCRLKQIIRYKPDKSTKSDLSLRLINIQQLEQYWNFFIKHLPSNQPTYNNEDSSRSVIDTNDKHSTILLSNSEEQPSENNSSSILPQSCQMDLSQSEIQSLLNHLIENIIEQQDQEQSQVVVEPSLEDQRTLLLTIENEIVKRKRRQSKKSPFLSKRRKRKQSKDPFQWWINKYSIQPFSICLDRVDLPID